MQEPNIPAEAEDPAYEGRASRTQGVRIPHPNLQAQRLHEPQVLKVSFLSHAVPVGLVLFGK